MAIAEQEITRSLSLMLSLDQWKNLEQAAATAGQSLEDFAVSALLPAADSLLTPAPHPLDKVIGIFKDEPLINALMERIHDERRLEMEATAAE